MYILFLVSLVLFTILNQIPLGIYILIADSGTFGTFQSYLHICKYTCQRVLCLLTWRHQQRVASHWETAKIAHDSHNDVRRIWGHAGAIFVLLAELGLRKPPSGNPEGLAWQGRRLHLPASAVVKQSPWIGGNVIFTGPVIFTGCS